MDHNLLFFLGWLYTRLYVYLLQITYNVALGVCIKAAEGRTALNLFAEMKAYGLTPGKIAYECTCDALEVILYWCAFTAFYCTSISFDKSGLPLYFRSSNAFPPYTCVEYVGIWAK